MALDLTPPPLGTRVLAGLFDAVAIVSLCVAAFVVPLFTQGVVLPMWGVLLAVLAYGVVPLVAFRQTLGFKLFGLELVNKDGHTPNAGDVLFRELVGRGYFPGAFVATVGLSLLAGLLSPRFRFMAPAGVAQVFFVVSAFFVLLALLGTALAVQRPDQRTLADLMAKSFVVKKRVEPPSADAEEREYQQGEARRRLRLALAFEVVLLGSAFVLPWLLTRKSESTEQLAQRLTLKRLATQFEQNPNDVVVAREYEQALRLEGDAETLAAVQATIAERKTRDENARFLELESTFQKHPDSEPMLVAYLEALEQRGRVDDAAQAYRRFLDSSDDHALRAGFARWLWGYQRTDEALRELEKAASADASLGGVRALRGQLLLELGRTKEAQEALLWAVLEDEDDDEARDALNRVNATLGAPPKALEGKVKQAYDAWAKQYRDGAVAK